MRRCFRRSPHDIVEAADALFHERGYAKTSLQAIADRSGFPKGNFYYHFKTKADILRAVVKMREMELRQEIDAMRAGARDPRERLADYWALIHDHPDHRHALGCPHGTLALELARNFPHLLEHALPPLDLMLAWLEEEFARSGFRNPQAGAQRLLAEIQGELAMSATLELIPPAAATCAPRARPARSTLR